MTNLHVLFVDTDILIANLHDRLNHIDYIHLLSRYDQIATTSLNVYELYFGYFKLENSKQKISKKVLGKEKFALENLVNSLEIYDLTAASAIKGADIYNELVLRGEIIKPFDCIIAGIIITSLHYDFLTGNVNHFNRIKRLNLISMG